ncbi:MAG: hypothetical protein ACUVXI_06500 [bacterium]
MIRVLLIAIPIVLGGYIASISPLGWAIHLGLISIALSIAGGALRRYPLILAGTALMAINYVSALLAEDGGPDIWGALILGMGLYLLLELGYDWAFAFRIPVKMSVYSQRGRYLAKSLIISAAGAFLVVTLALNFLERLPPAALPWLAIPSALVIVVGAGSLIRFWLKSSSS